MRLYDRREWSIFFIVFTFCVWPFFGFLTYFKMPPNYMHYLYLLFFLVGPLLTLADRGSLRVTVAQSKMRFQMGFFFCRREIGYEKIAKVTFEKEPKSSYGRAKGFFITRSFSAGSKYPGFKMDLADGDYCVVQSRYTHEILAAIKQAAPFLNIE